MVWREITLLSIPCRILAALVLSGVIGMERGLKNRAAGFRTYMLVCIGSCMIMMINQFSYQSTGLGDPVRMGAQVISGIGFLGAGSIIVTTHNQIKGLTTAAGLWTSACIGLSLGFGMYEVALVGGIAIFLVLTLLHKWENRMRRNAKVLTVYIELSPGFGLSDFLQTTRELALDVSNLQLESDNSAAHNTVCFMTTVRGKERVKRDALLTMLHGMPCVRYLEEL